MAEDAGATGMVSQPNSKTKIAIQDHLNLNDQVSPNEAYEVSTH